MLRVCTLLLMYVARTAQKVSETDPLLASLFRLLVVRCSLDNDESLNLPGSRAHELFDMWVNTCPNQGSRTIRTEEAVLITLARLQPAIQHSTAAP